MKQFSSQAGKEKALTDFGERLLFVIWLAGKKLGVDSNKDFADAIGKRSSQLSKWLTEDPRPEWTSIRAIAEPVGVDPNWLDDPSNPRAVVPDDYPEWIAARRERASQRQA